MPTRRNKQPKTSSLTPSSGDKLLAPRLRRLAHAIHGSPSPQGARGLDHTEVEEFLVFYVDDERRGEPVQDLYPAIFEHLQTCERCRTSYLLLAESLAAVSEVLHVWKHLQPKVVPPKLDLGGWTRQVRARIGGARLGLVFSIFPEHLQRTLAPHRPALALREHAEPVTRSLLLSDLVELGPRQVSVQAWLERSQSNSLRLEVSVICSTPFPSPLRAVVRWDGHHLVRPLQDGAAVFEEIAADELERARDLHIEFEEAPPE